MKVIAFLLLSLLVTVNAVTRYTNNGADWTDALCQNGTRQSPINIDTKYTSILTDKSVSIDGMNVATVTLSYDASHLQITDDFVASATLRSDEDEREYTFVNTHFHAPSEHTVDGVQADLESHTVFARQGRTYADYLVLGVMWVHDNDAKNDSYLAAINAGGLTTTPSTQSISNVPFKDFYGWASPKEKYTYIGSLTTPNCTENVEWFVVKETRKINSAQLSEYTSKWAGNSGFASGKGNNRILRPLGARQVYLTHGEKIDKWELASIILVCLLGLLSAILSGMIFYQCVYKKNKNQSNKGYGRNSEAQGLHNEGGQASNPCA
eukprot:CAMPEP_0197001130 /NCGR_PEP_ID=MMETSP1380-20130617/5897_1 /TAXON_ID=5936 /ORGANISM="Euplotes crassus, Strain CT5" /LENGTH=322 /DNA_ID=CAMNT_0042418675 /DNA_START=20 /DNA_END=988 /DNA_ORIENTATION=-